jgi:hypothetical protein
MQPINNSNINSGNNSIVNIYNDGTKKEDKKTDETPTQTTEPTPDSKISDSISEGVKNAASNAVRDYSFAFLLLQIITQSVYHHHLYLLN